MKRSTARKQEKKSSWCFHFVQVPPHHRPLVHAAASNVFLSLLTRKMMTQMLHPFIASLISSALWKQTQGRGEKQLIGLCWAWLTSNLSHFVCILMCFGKMGVFRGDRAIIQLKMLQKHRFEIVSLALVCIMESSFLCNCKVDFHLSMSHLKYL